MENVRLAIIGCGGMPYNVLYDCTKTLPVELCAISGGAAETKKFSARYNVPHVYEDYRQMLAEQSPDLVMVFTAPEQVYEIAADCLRAGAYVYGERPVCMDSKSAEALIRIQKETGRYAVARYNRRHIPAYMVAKEIIGRKEFGRITMLTGKFNGSGYEDRQMLWYHFSHLIDAVRYLVGDIKLLHAERSVFGQKEICYNITCLLPGGGVGILQSGSTQCVEYPMERIEVAGDGCNVIVDNTRHVEYNRKAPTRLKNADMVLNEGADTLFWNHNPSHMRPFSYFGLDGCMENLVASVQAKVRPDFDMEDTIGTIRILEEIESRLVDTR